MSTVPDHAAASSRIPSENVRSQRRFSPNAQVTSHTEYFIFFARKTLLAVEVGYIMLDFKLSTANIQDGGHKCLSEMMLLDS